MTAKSTHPLLFSPLTLRGITTRNRIVASPMCQYRSDNGCPNEWHLVHLGRMALGGAGIVFTEETAVEPRGRKTYDCAGIWNQQQVQGYRRITDFIRSIGSIPAIQLGHCGRRAGTHGPMRNFAVLTDADAKMGRPPWTGIAPSPLRGTPDMVVPLEMQVDDIKVVVRAFAEAAKRSAAAGFDICEIHGAHGYLIHQFLSPVSNQRTDRYGGDRNGRMHFALEVVEAVRRAWPEDKPLFFRLSAVDGEGGIWDQDDTVAFSRELVQRGVDVIDCSSGGISGDSAMPKLANQPGYQVPFAERVRRDAGAQTMAVGLLTDPHHCELILREGKADLVALARELMLRGDWPVQAAKELGLSNYLDLFPADYAWRLKRRETGLNFTSSF
ncbi:NADH:flavin oxidoreductase/NADH oxidase [Bradyrhizobium liaoningense]|uniref:NADH:flavin oxidoreductase/NADH oxidase n=1 Tax=Bradyrhizobium liaoningense TaxID=43992 RepID=UPI001BA647FC|nr:NADH:flavin oxidoreductase/NADH oxidase [Bradyrhizobium liaoningense]MBR0859177.1 NADH:flavin oxidoreductase/NADH oxidase [Bradyrhizobium liaoningense]